MVTQKVQTNFQMVGPYQYNQKEQNGRKFQIQFNVNINMLFLHLSSTKNEEPIIYSSIQVIVHENSPSRLM